MNYELIPTEVIEDTYMALVKACNFIRDTETRLQVERAYKSLNRNRTAVNVRPNEQP